MPLNRSPWPGAWPSPAGCGGRFRINGPVSAHDSFLTCDVAAIASGYDALWRPAGDERGATVLRLDG